MTLTEPRRRLCAPSLSFSRNELYGVSTGGIIRTGIFGGTFDPIHIGHLALANYLCEYGELDELWLVLSPQNPFKRDRLLLDDALRLEMVRAAVAGYPSLQASDVEFHLPKPSYMVHTLSTLIAAHPDRRFTLVIGADNWVAFPRWYASDEILRLCDVIVYPRPGYDIDPATLPDNVRIVPTPLLEISSTFIRDSIRNGKDVRYFLHPAVHAIITSKGLYK